MKIIAAILFVALMGAGLGQADEPEGAVRVLECGARLCIVVKEDFLGLLTSNNAQYERAEKAEAELKKLREIKGCAKLEVTEPPRFFKRDRDS